LSDLVADYMSTGLAINRLELTNGEPTRQVLDPSLSSPGLNVMPG
jgi:hypothetical protein